MHRIVAAIDPGYAVNPAQIERQVSGLVRLRPHRAALRRMHRQGRRHRADQLRHLQMLRIARDAEGRDHHHAVGRLLGRRRRADHLGGGARRAQRHLRGDRQAHPLGPAAADRSRARMRAGGVVVLAVMVGAAAPPPGASSCSGCHGGVSPVPVLAGRKAGRYHRGDGRVPDRHPTGHRDGPDRQGFHARRDGRDRRMVGGAEVMRVAPPPPRPPPARGGGARTFPPPPLAGGGRGGGATRRATCKPPFCRCPSSPARRPRHVS